MKLKTVLLTAVFMACAFAAQAITIDMVPVGNPGNHPDTKIMKDGTTGYGSVNYTYRIGKYELTNAQYCLFLNANLPSINSDETGTVLADDTYGLYNLNMETQDYGGINYNPGAGTGTKFSVKTGYANRPVVLVCWYDAIRFVNWLQNSPGNGGTESGTYTITGGGKNSGSVSVPDATTRASWASLHWVLPTEDEWYKAAYYKGGGTIAEYWNYPTQHDTTPSNVLSASGTNNANYNAGSYSSPIYTDPTYYVTPVGTFLASPGPYDTFDQGGNVQEWNETLTVASARGMRGGGFNEYVVSLESSSRLTSIFDPFYEGGAIGFRVASVPEPGCIAMLLSSAAVGLIWWKRRK
jgi:formylglycine-generating enzyme